MGSLDACALDLAEDVEHHDDTDVQEADEHYGLWGQLEAVRVLGEEGELVALAVGPALAHGERRASALLLGAVNGALLGAFFS